MKTRPDSDSIGTLQIPVDAYYGVQSLRGMQNFPITGNRMHPMQIMMLAALKKACAIANFNAGALDKKICDAIIAASEEIMAGKLHDEFIVDPIQGGAGTSANMNANEVIANRACELLGGKKGDYSLCHPNDHVNMSQSTNDIYPASGKLAALGMLPGLLNQLRRLEAALLEKAEEFDDVLKVGRTQMQDAVPIRLGQEFHAYASAIHRDINRIDNIRSQIAVLNMGATAIGTAINVPASYLEEIADEVSKATGIEVANAVSLSKICNDLRLMSSGPKTGFGEINLPAQQNGSSIMPGKVNPVIPEVVTQVCYAVMGNDVTITKLGRIPLTQPDPLHHFGHTAGAMYTDAPSLAKLLDLIVQGGFSGDKRIISTELMGEMTRVQASTPTRTYGLGLVLLNRPAISDKLLLGHQGFAYGCVDGAFIEGGTGRKVIFLNGGASEAREGKLGLVNKDVLTWAFRKEFPTWM